MVQVQSTHSQKALLSSPISKMNLAPIMFIGTRIFTERINGLHGLDFSVQIYNLFANFFFEVLFPHHHQEIENAQVWADMVSHTARSLPLRLTHCWRIRRCSVMETLNINSTGESSGLTTHWKTLRVLSSTVPTTLCWDARPPQPANTIFEGCALSKLFLWPPLFLCDGRTEPSPSFQASISKQWHPVSIPTCSASSRSIKNTHITTTPSPVLAHSCGIKHE